MSTDDSTTDSERDRPRRPSPSKKFAVLVKSSLYRINR
ncbi:unnamed protein product [Oikopleura dioica]|uniref:Uncharacterized protein n=1 Tax=Oikopleura dioica TaxID=34765 RepID=E4XQW3_OIKDI|nr:unnamed protein product [Oikopleura dioica]CBY33591.1 unnamed protein product [Oikopleura dioica]